MGGCSKRQESGGDSMVQTSKALRGQCWFKSGTFHQPTAEARGEQVEIVRPVRGEDHSHRSRKTECGSTERRLAVRKETSMCAHNRAVRMRGGRPAAMRNRKGRRCERCGIATTGWAGMTVSWPGETPCANCTDWLESVCLGCVALTIKPRGRARGRRHAEAAHAIESGCASIPRRQDCRYALHFRALPYHRAARAMAARSVGGN